MKQLRISSLHIWNSAY